MFFLKLEGRDLERLLKLATEKKGTPVERIARLAFLKGLRLLAKADAETDTSCLLGEKRPYTRRKPLVEVQVYIRENWQQQTDKQIGKALGYVSGYIRRIRLDLGYRRPKGRWGGPGTLSATATAEPLSRTERRDQKYAKLDALIGEHWETKDDGDIGRMLEPNVSRREVLARRYELGLKKVQGAKRGVTIGGAVREVVDRDREEFERMVLREGYTMTEYLRLKNLTCTRERLRQVVEELGLKHSPENRTPEWALVRRARKVGHLNLADREWLKEKIAHYQSMAALSSELGIEDSDLFFFIRSFRLSHPSFRKYGAETVNLVCVKCGTAFTRLKKWVDHRLKKANGHPQEFFCSQSCTGQWNRERVRRRTEEKSAKQLERERVRAEKKERHAAFISENWQTMPDAQLALALELSVHTIAQKRIALGFRRVQAA